MPKAYVIGQNTIKNLDKYKLYAEKVPKTLVQFGGKFLSRGGDTLILDGEPAGKRNVIIEFPDIESAKAWYFSSDYQKIVTERKDNATGYLIISEGVS
ncbi:MAG: hypothetical protein CBD16_06325 [Betaproteobacteria bacterium TMED156]|nr:MAG: hypothetical protein CBD16_06325 [Betaproteobacteria bacterium TMED156]|tara:strand:- start:378 stop:671 length:294 start_codon:yes stop_codon:yes gene_type:complete